MHFCTSCGYGLGLGRFCTNCGTPVDAASPAPTTSRDAGDTAERPAVRATVPPSPAPTPAPTPAPPRPAPAAPARPAPADEPASFGGRFPLYADQAGSEVPAGPAAVAGGPGRPAAAMTGAQHGDEGDHRRRRGLPFLAAAAVLLIALLGGVAWLAGSDDTTGTEASSELDRPSANDPADDPAGPGGAPPADEADAPEDLAPHSRVSGPEPVAPSRDLEGDQVRYPATNTLDDDPETAYRMPGDATGASIVFTLPQEATVDQVGLVNGYAKVDTSGGRTVDWYDKNRRILEVEWVFDDGTTVTQQLDEDPALQTVAVDDVRTKTIELRVVEVSAPGAPPLSKDVTAISDVLIHGS